MNIKGYRLTSMEEPTDEMLHELMKQVAESACKSTYNAQCMLRKKLEETVAEIHKHKVETSATRI